MLKTIMVHLDSGKLARARLQFAATLAKSHGARIVGAFGQRAEADQVGFVFTWPSHAYMEAAAEVRKMFEEVSVGTLDAEWLDINRGSDDEILKRLASAARYCDLLVMGQGGPEEESRIAEYMPEEVAAISGRPILVTPHRGEWNPTGLRPLIVWDESAESARAIKESLHLIQPSAEVMVLSFGVSKSAEDDGADNIVRFLASHGVAASSESHESLEVGAWEVILKRLASLDSDLLVIGAHEQLGFPFVRREVVRSESPVPVFMTS